METDPAKIKVLAEEKEDENYEFRSFLKNSDSDKVDRIVHRLYEEISSQIDCRECSNCCIEKQPSLGKQDIEKLSVALKISEAQFSSDYLVKDEDSDDLIFNKEPCPLLKKGLCSQYEHRPKVCVSYPHLHKEDFVFRLFKVIDNCSVCPIVYNVYESLKKEMRFISRWS